MFAPRDWRNMLSATIRKVFVVYRYPAGTALLRLPGRRSNAGWLEGEEDSYQSSAMQFGD